MKKNISRMLSLVFFTSQMLYSNAIILNEYNAVGANKQLANNGYDTYFGDIDGNGGSWIEFVVVQDYIDIRDATITIKQNGGVAPFSATFPNWTQLAHLRKGTIFTISNEPSDLSYDPSNNDWSINISKDDLNTTQGTFITSNNELKIKIISSNNKDILMPNSGESLFNVGISDTEIFKLKKDPSDSIEPDNPNYGDDNGKQIISTFGSPNQWIDTNKSALSLLAYLTLSSSSINLSVCLVKYI